MWNRTFYAYVNTKTNRIEIEEFFTNLLVVTIIVLFCGVLGYFLNEPGSFNLLAAIVVANYMLSRSYPYLYSHGYRFVGLVTAKNSKEAREEVKRVFNL